MPKISVIVPVYNVEDNINKCLNSLFNQSLNDIEIIVINCMISNSINNLLKPYINENNKVILKIIDENINTNEFISMIIKYAKGEYISVINCNDYISFDMYEKMYYKAKEDNYDLVYCNIEAINNTEKRYIKAEVKKDYNNINLKDKKRLLLKSYPVLFNKIIKKSILMKKDFEYYRYNSKNIWTEDLLLLHKLVPKINSIAYINEYLYHHIYTKQKTSTPYNNILYYIVNKLEIIIEYYKYEGLFDDYEEIIEYLYIRCLYINFIKKIINAKEYSSSIKNYNKFKRKFKENFPNINKIKIFKIFKPTNTSFKNFNYLIY